MIAQLYEPFKKWSDGGSVWILSDPHFDDEDSKFMDPNWIPPEEQISIINSLVYRNDTLVLLGDIGNPDPYMQQIRSRYKVLVMGNHDQSKNKYKPYFNEIYEGPVFISPKILLSHEPISLPFCLNIHGHDHNGIEHYQDGCKHINLAANVCGYTPINLGKIIKDGILSDITSIHRQTIDRAEKRKWR